MKFPFQDFKVWVSRRKSESTAKSYVYDIVNYFEYLSDTGQDISGHSVDMYLLELQKQGKSPNYIRKKFFALKAMFKFLGRVEEVENIEIPPSQEPQNVRVTRFEDVKRLLEACEYIEDSAMVLLLYDCALRVSELINLKKSDIDLQFKKITVKTLKGRNKAVREREVPMSDITVATVSKLIEMHEAQNIRSEYLFVNVHTGKPYTAQTIRNRLRSLSLAAGFNYVVNPHSLRHGRGTDIGMSGKLKSSHALSAFMGHSNPSSTKRYIHPKITDIVSNVPKIEELEEEKKYG